MFLKGYLEFVRSILKVKNNHLRKWRIQDVASNITTYKLFGVNNATVRTPPSGYCEYPNLSVKLKGANVITLFRPTPTSWLFRNFDPSASS